MSWCLIKSEADKFRKALKDRTIDPEKLTLMDSTSRREFLATFVGEENAKRVNTLFESKLILKNQKAGYISWAKRVAGITKATRMDLLSRIDRLDTVLTPQSEKVFLQDLASQRLKVGVTMEEAQQIAKLYRDVKKTQEKMRPDFTFAKEEDRLAHGLAKVKVEEYFAELKLTSQKIPFLEHPVRATLKGIGELPGIAKSIVASLDNSFFGRQGIKTLYTHPDIWTRNFLKSWNDIAKELGGRDAISIIKADIYSRPNALNMKYQTGGFGLSVISEEAFPTSLPERIPIFRRLFRASESAYNGAALRMRADLADKYIAIAEANGVNMLNREEAQGIGRVISSLTGRGSLGHFEGASKEINVVLFSAKFIRSNIDTLTAHAFDPKVNTFAKKQASLQLLRIVGSMAGLLLLANLFDPDAVEEDPRSANFGKIKIFGHWTDLSGGMGSLVTLASRLTPTLHNGKWGLWTKSKSGEYQDLLGGKYGQQTALDIFNSFWEGKLSPLAGMLRDVWAGRTFGGVKTTPTELLKNQLPISIQTYKDLMNDPNSSSIVGSMLLDGLGFSVSTSPEPNIKSGYIPENTKISNGDFIDKVMVYAQAIGVDPETAFNRIFTGQTIRRVTNGTIIVERMPLSESQSIKKKAGADNPTMKLDHRIPLELGGSNDKDNLWLVTTSKWESYTPVENMLARALADKKISKDTAQKLIVQFKNGSVTREYIESQVK